MKRTYRSPEYNTIFDLETGFSMRWGKTIDDDPFMAPGPELVDVSITNKCNSKCEYCYANSTPEGDKFMTARQMEQILDKLPKTVQQIAIGGGDPPENPEFADILSLIRSRDIVPNYTYSGEYILSDEVLTATKKNCGVAAVSWHGDHSLDAVRNLVFNGIKTNVHFVVSSYSVDEALRLLVRPEARIVNAVIFLLWKPQGRAKAMTNEHIYNGVDSFLRNVNRHHKKFVTKVGFDSCFMSGVMTTTDFDKTLMDSCESARFSLFVDTDGKCYPCSFCDRPSASAPNILEKPFEKVWDQMEWFRNRQRAVTCECEEPLKSECKGGCPIFPSVNLCSLPGKKIIDYRAGASLEDAYKCLE